MDNYIDSIVGNGVLFIMSPTFHKEKNIRFFVNSREEERKHIHAKTLDGEVKIWLEPEIEISKNYRVSEKDLREIMRIVKERYDEFIGRWNSQFSL